MANEPSKTPIPAMAQTIPLSKIHDLPGIFIGKPQDKTLGGLVSSIQSGGVKDPVILRALDNGEYQLVSGYRRRRACELAKLTDIPAFVYEMTLQEAQKYRRIANTPKASEGIPGKLIEPVKGKDAEKQTDAAKPDAPGKDGKTEGKPAESKDAEKQTDAAKPDASGKDGKAEDKPTEGKDVEKQTDAAKSDAPGKDGKAEDKPTEGKDAEKQADAAKPDAPNKDGKEAVKPAEDKSVEKSGKEDKPAEKQGEAEHKPTVAELEAQAKAGKPVNISDIIDAQQREREAKRAAVAEKGKDKLKGTLRPSDAEAKRMEKTTEKKAPAAEKAADAPAQERAAEGPAGTAISQIFDKRLDPPDEAAIKALPVPQEGESFFITLHPAYLKKSEFNTFSVDTESENFKELLKSVELVGIKDPVLARFGKDGMLEILSGQRRHLAAVMLNQAVPTIIQKIDDADAKIIVADGNLHRDKISSYDLSRALRMKMEGMKQKAGRRKKGYSAEELHSDVKLAQEMGMSVGKLNRFVRLSEAIKGICDLVDEDKLKVSVASSISFLKPSNQEELLHLMDLGYKPTYEQTERMKKIEVSGKLTEAVMRDVMEDKDIAPKKQTPPPAPPVPPAPTGENAAPSQSAPNQSTPSAAPAPESIPASPDVAAPTQPAAPGVPSAPPPAAPASETPAAQQNAGAPEAAKEDDPFKGAQERPEVTKVILTGDRLRKYFPDVNMTPREIEESVYEALEERRQRQERQKQKDAIFKKPGGMKH